MSDFLGDDSSFFELREFNEKNNGNASVIYGRTNSSGKVIGQSGFKSFRLSNPSDKTDITWQSVFKETGVTNISIANLTLYEPSGKATGVFVFNGRDRVPGTNFPYYTMKSEKTNSTFENYATIAIGKDGSVKLYETDDVESAEKKVLKDLYKIKYAFSGPRWLIKNGGELNTNIGILQDDKNRAKTSVGFTKTHILVAVTRYSTSEDAFPAGRKQTWTIWANTLRPIEPTATWVSMDGGGSPGIVINGSLKKGTSRKIPTVIYWT